jgi:hypothetical protein
LRPIFFIRTAPHDLERVIRQWPLQHLCLIPWRAPPNVSFLVGRQDHRHGLGMDRLNDGVRRCSQEAIDEVRAGDRLRLCATLWLRSRRLGFIFAAAAYNLVRLPKLIAEAW